MQKIIWMTLLGWVLIPLGVSAYPCPNWDPRGDENKPTVYILAVGVNTGTLKKADDDAKKFAREMKAYYQRRQYSSRICLLLNKKTSRNALRNALVKLKNKSTKQDIVIFYFSGHGTYQVRGPGYCPEERIILARQEEMGDKALMLYLANIHVSELHVFLDTCHATGLIRVAQGCPGKKTKFKATENSGLYNKNCRESETSKFLHKPTYQKAFFYTAAKAEQDAFETNQGGVFTQAFLGVLKNSREPLRKIFRKTSDRVARNEKVGCRQQPQLLQNGKVLYPMGE